MSQAENSSGITLRKIAMGFGKWFLDLLKQADEYELEKMRINNRTPTEVKNYFITMNNRVIKVTEKEFREWVRQNQLKHDGRMLLE